MISEVTYLASDELEGRQTGTDSEKLAAEYISSKFEHVNKQYILLYKPIYILSRNIILLTINIYIDCF